MGANNGTGWPLSFWCSVCRKNRGLDLDKNRHDAPGRDVVRTGRTRSYTGGNRGARGLNTFHEYTCSHCGHTGWSRHVDMVKKPQKNTIAITKRHVQLLKRIANGDCPRASHREYQELRTFEGVGTELQIESAHSVDTSAGYIITNLHQKIGEDRAGDAAKTWLAAHRLLVAALTGTPMQALAARINVHLRRFEADHKINTNTKPDRTGLARFYNAWCGASGSRIFTTYISYQGQSSLTRTEAQRYLAWLDAGNVGRHFEALH